MTQPVRVEPGSVPAQVTLIMEGGGGEKGRGRGDLLCGALWVPPGLPRGEGPGWVQSSLRALLPGTQAQPGSQASLGLALDSPGHVGAVTLP